MQYAQLLTGCVVLGVGVALMLEAALGSDGYSTLVNGLTIASGLEFWQLNIVVGAAFVGLAWARGTRPGPGTLVQWFFVGFVISGVMAAIPEVGVAAGAGRHARRRPRPHRGRGRGLPGERHRRRPGRGDGTRLGPTDPVPLELQPRPVRRCARRMAARCGRGAGHDRGLRAARSGRRPRSDGRSRGWSARGCPQLPDAGAGLSRSPARAAPAPKPGTRTRPAWSGSGRGSRRSTLPRRSARAPRRGRRSSRDRRRP